MKIIADVNIPFVKEAFKYFGEIELVHGRDIDNETVKDADILLVRSVTKVNKELLYGSKVKFVATATIGIDHIDIDYLNENNIGFASAPGSNADSVAEYVVSGLLNLSRKYNFNLNEKKAGIIGVGNVGSRVKKRLEILGVKCLLNDPPKQRETQDNIYLPLNKVLEASDIVTVHVPLNKTGIDATLHLINDEFILKMKKKSILINTSRGKVMNESSIIKNKEKLLSVILDVWETEPKVNIDTLNITDIATPHIAGYSYDGKVRGTEMIYHAACDYFKIEKKWDKTEFIKPEKDLLIDLRRSKDPVFDAVNFAYPIMQDDKNLRAIKNIDLEKHNEYFDKLRKNYPKRREFFNYSLLYNNNLDKFSLKVLSKLGFKI